jgi:ATPase subunit of ABC transporter with duplicated ATPase domains
MLRVVDLTVEVGHRLLVAEASFTVAPGDVVGLVGPNGAGKTSLLRTVSERARSKRDPSVTLVGELAWLPQESPPTTASTGLARLLSARGLDRTRAELEEARRRIDQSADTRSRDRAIKRFSNLQERFEAEGGYRAEAEARRVAAGLGLPSGGLDRPLSGLSGGERRRVELARVLLSEARTLLLDEPTNHLDADAKRWLAGFLADFSGGILLVSHDLPLLDRDVTGVLVLDPLTASIETYKGTWTQYLEASEVRARSEAKERKVMERDIKRLSAFVEKYRHSNEVMARRAMVTERRVEKMKQQLTPERRSGRKVAVRFPDPPQ